MVLEESLKFKCGEYSVLEAFCYVCLFLHYFILYSCFPQKKTVMNKMKVTFGVS